MEELRRFLEELEKNKKEIDLGKIHYVGTVQTDEKDPYTR